MQRVFLSLLLGLLAACAKPHPLDALEPGERGRVVRILDGDALVLDTGQSVRLAGIEAPARPYKDREGEPFQEEARRMLEDMTLGREVQLFYAGLTRDRYDRALAQVRTMDALGPDLWLNAEMLRRGGARMRIYPDTAGGSEAFPELEAEARTERRGLWAKQAYRVPDASALPEGFERFRLVQGKVAGMTGSETFRTSCELALLNSPVRLEIANAAAAYCQLPEGTDVLARGYVREERMEVSHRLNLQVLPPSPPPPPA
ncbi:MAG: thermonuclease family protein [Hyphomonas sp.]